MKLDKTTIKKGLEELFPSPVCELNYSKDYELLLSVMLSAQTTDKRVNEVMDSVYREYDSLEKLGVLSAQEIEEKIKKIGFYRAKAINFKKIVSELLSNGGSVPNNREFLEGLPGVGRKTASVVLAVLFDEPSMAVDTHVFRVSQRLGITNEKDDVLSTESKLKKFFDKTDWNKINSSLVLFGRYICVSRKPKCSECPFYKKCKVTEKN